MAKFKKGSPEAKAYMAYLRNMRGKGGRGGGKKKHLNGGALITASTIFSLLKKAYRKTVGKWFGKRLNEAREQEKRIEQLQGGKTRFDGRDVIDTFAGPIGWIMMARRKKRAKEIKELEAQRQRNLKEWRHPQ